VNATTSAKRSNGQRHVCGLHLVGSPPEETTECVCANVAHRDRRGVPAALDPRSAGKRFHPIENERRAPTLESLLRCGCTRTHMHRYSRTWRDPVRPSRSQEFELSGAAADRSCPHTKKPASHVSSIRPSIRHVGHSPLGLVEKTSSHTVRSSRRTPVVRARRRMRDDQQLPAPP